MKNKKIFLSLFIALVFVFTISSFAQANVTLRIGTVTQFLYDHVEEMAEEFTEETGIEVVIETYIIDDLMTKVQIESIGETGYFDIIRSGGGLINPWREPGWLEPLDDYVAREDYDFEDLTPEAREKFAQVPDDDKVWGIPMDIVTQIFAYRTDLFEDPDEQAAFEEQYGYELAPPETTDQWLDMAEFFTRDTTGDGENDLHGFAMGQRMPETYFWPMYVAWTWGVDIFDNEAIESNFNDPRVIEAYEWAKEMHEYQPPGVLGWTFKEEYSQMAAGNIAMAQIFATENALPLLDPEETDYYDDIGFTTIPRHPDSGLKVGCSHYGGGSLHIHKHSENKEEAWEFLSWLTGKEMAPRLALEANTVTPRHSVMGDEELLAKNPNMQKVIPPYEEQLAEGTKLRPTIPEAASVLEQWALAWHSILVDDVPIEDAVNEAHENIEALLEEAGY